MNGPSKQWRHLRLAALDRACRETIEPLAPLYTIHAAVCVLYLVGFLRFRLFDYSVDAGWLITLQITLVFLAGILVPILTGSVFTLHFFSRRLQRLTNG